jgi:hypothetical protein
MFFRKKANGSGIESQRQDSQRHLRKRKLNLAIDALRSRLFEMLEVLAENRQTIFKGNLEAFATEATREPLARKAFLDDLAGRLVDDVRQNSGPVNEILKQLDTIILLASGD